MLLSEVEYDVRQDLSDMPSSTQRWDNSAIDRAIDKALLRYVQYYPNIAFADMASQPFQRTYPYPTSFNPNLTVLWIEKIIYPLQSYGSQFNPPSAGMQASLPGASTQLSVGTYKYAVTFLSQGGETPISPLVSITTTPGNQKVLLSNIPIGPPTPSVPGAATNTVIGRNIYRSDVGAGQSTLKLLTTIQDNVTTTFTDSTPDAQMVGQPAPPSVNTSGVMLWPPFERDFAEYSNLYDSTVALAAGGNLGNMGAVGSQAGQTGTAEPSFTLKLSSAELPQDSTQCMRIFYATKHQLDNTGSTIPEIHRDVIVLGATAYCMEAYQVPTNDNFDFQDGALRDRIDDSMIASAWLKAANNRMQQFIARLEEIKQQRDFAASARANWGDVAARYHRL